ncbi:hypothetical protein [Fluviicola taffensis]|uniref:Lipoprotein n=1 Tax=Fluviicola taffensis (strain DSM 16823 / NCIMB 13979 / RW262) TaxID=755732 RepID=F2IEM9_FLUTR|nr:hypothetical protein [Fluviicola taffensis]AEA44568.1 hypothetical protein Fluta_2584 [Fluviicola taffensis DSM 16823]
MRTPLFFLLIGLIFFSCKKDKIQPTISSNYYQSSGNLLILKIGDSLESVYEYNLASSELTNDSLPLYIDTNSNVVNDYTYWKFSPNPDTLLWNSSTDFSFLTSEIDKTKLQLLNYSIPFDSTKFQLLFPQSNINCSLVWSKISNLDIVKTYRNSYPNSKIGLSKVLINEYDESIGFTVPRIKFLVFLVKE